MEENELSLESLSARIDEVRDNANKSLTEMRAQIEELKKKVADNDNVTTRRLVKITNIIDSAFDNLQQIMVTIGDLTNRMNDCEKEGQTTANTLSRNRTKLVELNKYLKQVDKTLQDGIKEIDKLNSAVDTTHKFHWKVGLAIFIGLVALIYLAQGGNARELIELLMSFWCKGQS